MTFSGNSVFFLFLATLPFFSMMYRNIYPKPKGLEINFKYGIVLPDGWEDDFLFYPCTFCYTDSSAELCSNIMFSISVVNILLLICLYSLKFYYFCRGEAHNHKGKELGIGLERKMKKDMGLKY